MQRAQSLALHRANLTCRIAVTLERRDVGLASPQRAG